MIPCLKLFKRYQWNRRENPERDLNMHMFLFIIKMSFLISEFICNLVSGVNKMVLGELNNIWKNKADSYVTVYNIIDYRCIKDLHRINLYNSYIKHE